MDDSVNKMLIGVANRDPLKFSNPDDYDIERKTMVHAGFWTGVHACSGMSLARLEMDCLFNALG